MTQKKMPEIIDLPEGRIDEIKTRLAKISWYAG